jgi:hypothetical protein
MNIGNKLSDKSVIDLPIEFQESVSGSDIDLQAVILSCI